jgi:Arc/MetJ-type ribon-helix-helix transcriptional regulator
MPTHRTHVVIPEAIVTEIDRLVGKRRRSEFITSAVQRELRRMQQIRALEKFAGSWKDQGHPELQQGASNWVQGLRQESERRLLVDK